MLCVLGPYVTLDPGSYGKEWPEPYVIKEEEPRDVANSMPADAEAQRSLGNLPWGGAGLLRKYMTWGLGLQGYVICGPPATSLLLTSLLRAAPTLRATAKLSNLPISSFLSAGLLVAGSFITFLTLSLPACTLILISWILEVQNSEDSGLGSLRELHEGLNLSKIAPW